MKYEDMINGLAEEILEKVANETEQEELEKEAGLALKPIPALKKGVKRVGELASGSKLKGLKGQYADINEDINILKTHSKLPGREDLAKTLMNDRKSVRGTMNKEKKAVRNFRVGTAGATAGAGAYAYKKNKVQEKAASYFEEAEFLKQAAEEAYQEAIIMQDAAVALYNRMEEE